MIGEHTTFCCLSQNGLYHKKAVSRVSVKYRGKNTIKVHTHKARHIIRPRATFFTTNSEKVPLRPKRESIRRTYISKTLPQTHFECTIKFELRTVQKIGIPEIGRWHSDYEPKNCNLTQV